MRQNAARENFRAAFYAGGRPATAMLRPASKRSIETEASFRRWFPEIEVIHAKRFSQVSTAPGPECIFPRRDESRPL